MRNIEKLFEAVGCPDDLRVSYAQYYLRKEADEWWQVSKEVYLVDLEFTWERFKERIRACFYPRALRRKKQ